MHLKSCCSSSLSRPSPLTSWPQTPSGAVHQDPRPSMPEATAPLSFATTQNTFLDTVQGFQAPPATVQRPRKPTCSPRFRPCLETESHNRSSARRFGPAPWVTRTRPQHRGIWNSQPPREVLFFHFPSIKSLTEHLVCREKSLHQARL